MKTGSILSVIGLLAGVWVLVAPYLIGFAPSSGTPWSRLMVGTDVIGILIILASLVGLVAFWGLRLKELTRHSHTLPED